MNIGVNPCDLRKGDQVGVFVPPVGGSGHNKLRTGSIHIHLFKSTEGTVRAEIRQTALVFLAVGKLLPDFLHGGIAAIAEKWR